MMVSRHSRKREKRRAQRDFVQNDLVLRGWMPVKLNDRWGIFHAANERAVLRLWVYPSAQETVPHYHRIGGVFNTAARHGHGGRYETKCVDRPIGTITECTWKDIQRRWVYELRAAAARRGWL